MGGGGAWGELKEGVGGGGSGSCYHQLMCSWDYSVASHIQRQQLEQGAARSVKTTSNPPNSAPHPPTHLANEWLMLEAHG